MNNSSSEALEILAWAKEEILMFCFSSSASGGKVDGSGAYAGGVLGLSR